MRVLYVNHTSTISGAEHSLLDLLSGVRDRVEPLLCCPEGSLASAARELGVPVCITSEISLSFRRETRQVVRGVRDVGLAARDIALAARRFRADVVHANSARAGLAAIAARAGGAPSPLVHVRDGIPEGAAGRLVTSFILHGARFVLANSHYTASRLDADGSPKLRVVYNSVDLDRFRPASSTRDAVREQLGLGTAPTLGVVAQLTPWKGQDDAIRTFEIVSRHLPEACLLLIGDVKFHGPATRYDNRSYAESLHRLAEECGVQERVKFLGERHDVPELLGALDVLMVPSWEEPFGKTVLEAMAAGVPVIATEVGGPSEVLENGVTGILLRPRDPQLWADAAIRVLDDTAFGVSLAARAKVAVRRFGPEAHIDTVLGLYRESLSPHQRASRPKVTCRS